MLAKGIASVYLFYKINRIHYLIQYPETSNQYLVVYRLKVIFKNLFSAVAD